ncbi:hypothetical protein [Marinomonas gallaica]|uniref:hypothetical protein n=1 Tax=Marinomonas gallaica TaxID=1806667 RepID=UPI003A8D76FA
MSYRKRASKLPEVARSALIQTNYDWHEARQIVLNHYGRSDMSMSEEVYIEDFLRDMCDAAEKEAKAKKTEQYRRMKDGY